MQFDFTIPVSVIVTIIGAALALLMRVQRITDSLDVVKDMLQRHVTDDEKQFKDIRDALGDGRASFSEIRDRMTRAEMRQELGSARMGRSEAREQAREGAG